MRNRFQLGEVLHMLVVDERFHLGVIALTRPDVTVERGVSKAEVVLVALAAETV